MVTDVSEPASVEALADATYERFGACHLLVNNAGVGAPSSTPWETTVNDWRWVHGVNVMGVVHGVLAFVPRMIEAGEPGHVVNTSSGDGGIEPLPDGVGLRRQQGRGHRPSPSAWPASCETEGTNLRASIFYPSGGLLRTGLWESERTRPAELARERPRTTEPMTVAKLEAMAEKGASSCPGRTSTSWPGSSIDGIKRRRLHLHDRPRVDRPTPCGRGPRPSRRAACPATRRARSAESSTEIRPTDRYLLISSDGHAGPPAEHYRDYLEPSVPPALRRPPGRASWRIREFQQSTTPRLPQGVGGQDRRRRPARRLRLRRPQREARRRGRGRRGAVPRRRRARHRPGGGARRSAPGLGSSARQRPRAGHGRGPGPQPLAGRLLRRGARAPHRRGGGADRATTSTPPWPRSRTVARPRPARRDDPDPLVRRARLPRPASTSRCGRRSPSCGMVLHTHSGAGPADYDIGPGFMAIYATEAYWWAARPLWVLLWAGVFERHPDLRYVDRRERRVVAARPRRPRWTRSTSAATTPRSSATPSASSLSMKPSEYIDRNCFLAASTPGVEDIDRRHEIGVGNLLWGNDFPHPEGTFPYTRELVRRRVQGRARRTRPAGCSASTPSSCTASTPRRWPRWSSASGPSSTEIHGDDAAGRRSRGR